MKKIIFIVLGAFVVALSVFFIKSNSIKENDLTKVKVADTALTSRTYTSSSK